MATSTNKTAAFESEANPQVYAETPLHSEKLTVWCALWAVKSLVYADKSQTIDHLEDNIHRVIADIRPQMLEKVIENWTSRLDYIRASRGSPMPEIIFKMTATAGSDIVQSGHPIFDEFFQHLWPYIGNNTANIVFQMVKRLWLIRIDQ
ncbi:hypothetical protein TNCV_2401701 [Trichonephila clavipes]|nr:hypothetical protein TNCV_2401701 [Trichonephila clavipes]